MLPIERVKKVIRLEKPDKVPVAPQVNEHSAKVLGVPYGDVFNDAELASQALLKCYEVYPGVDMSFGGGYGFIYYSPYADAHSSWLFNWKLPKPGEDEIPQMLEDQIISGDQYDLLMEKGLLYFIRPNHPEINQFFAMLVKQSKAMAPVEKLAAERGLFNYAMSLINVPTDVIANLRGLNGYLTDFYDRPEKIKQVCDWMVDDLIAMGLNLARQVDAARNDGCKTILIGSNRASASYVSPKMFEEFAWPYLHKEVMAVIDAGFTPVIHLDGNWTPMAHYFKAFPKAKCLFHVDDQNDIFQWKKILGGHSALMGNVAASLLSHGDRDEVDAYCRRLIEEVGEGGGFILANACSLPYDAKIENVQAMIRASEKYGVY
jgi:hypothetical protein